MVFVARASCSENVIIGIVLHAVDRRLHRERMQQHGIDFLVEKPYGVTAFRRAIAHRDFN